MTIPLKQVIQAIEEASEVFTSFWDTKTGKTVYLADPLMADLTEESKERMMQHLSSILPGASAQQLMKILKG